MIGFSTDQVIALACVAVFVVVSLSLATIPRVILAALAAAVMAAVITAAAVVLNMWLVMPI